MKKVAILAIACLGFFAFTENTVTSTNPSVEAVNAGSFSILNDTKGPVSIHTGSGFVTLNKGSKTSVTCNVGKEVSYGENGKKGSVIFKITDSMCGETVRLPDYI